MSAKGHVGHQVVDTGFSSRLSDALCHSSVKAFTTRLGFWGRLLIYVTGRLSMWATGTGTLLPTIPASCTVHGLLVLATVCQAPHFPRR